MTSNTENEKPNFEELYSSAVNTSNLRVEADHTLRGPADIIMSAAWSPNRFGALMLRLHSEWDGAEKPEKPTDAAVRALASTVDHHDPEKGPVKLGLAGAVKQATEWYQHEQLRLMGKLKTLPQARHQLALVAINWKVADPEGTAAAVIKFWLDQTCQGCDGRRWKVILGTPKLSNKVCGVCSGSGVGQVPRGQEGRRLANYIDECVGDAMQSIRSRLSRMMERKT